MRRYSPLVAAALLIVLASPCASLAQSGRKQKKAEPQPPVQGVNQPELRTQQEATVAPEEDKAKEKDRTWVEVMSNMPDIGIPIYYTDVARQAFSQELRKYSKTVQLSDGGNNKNRKDAMDAAKNSDKTYAVLLELQSDQYGGNGYGFDLRYWVFEPKTGKQIAFGSGYPARPNGMPQPPIGMSRIEVYIEWAARDVAQRVAEKLGLRSAL
jgi:hypothetical protein